MEKPSISLNASDQADKFLEKMNIGQGWDDEKKAYISVGISEFSTNDPVADRSFITKRDLKSMVSILNSKADIIEYIENTMSAEDKVDIPGTDINKKFSEEKDALVSKLQAQADKLKLYKKYLDKKELSMLEGATYGDYTKEFMTALISKLDKKFNSGIIEAKKRKEYEEAKNRYESANNNIDALSKRLRNLTQNATEKVTSEVKLISKLPLFGTTALAQFESYNKEDGIFQIATVVIWSAKMEKAARAMIEGKDYRIPTRQTKTIQQWVNSTDWSSATGVRKFVDKNGVTHFVGISAMPIRGKTSTARRKAKGMSELFARKNAVMSVFSDVESSKQAQAVMQTYSDGEDYEESQAMESFEKHLKQSFKNRKVHGTSKRYSKVLIHPITHQKMHVSIYSIDQVGASKALMLQEKTYLTQILDIKSQNKLKGRSDAFIEKVESTKNDKTDYYNEKRKTTNEIKQKEHNKQNYNNHQIKYVPKNDFHSKEQEYKVKTQVVEGGGTSDNFDW